MLTFFSFSLDLFWLSIIQDLEGIRSAGTHVAMIQKYYFASLVKCIFAIIATFTHPHNQLSIGSVFTSAVDSIIDSFEGNYP